MKVNQFYIICSREIQQYVRKHITD